MLERILVVVVVDNLVEVADRHLQLVDRHLELVDRLHIAVELDLVGHRNLVEPC